MITPDAKTRAREALAQLYVGEDRTLPPIANHALMASRELVGDAVPAQTAAATESGRSRFVFKTDTDVENEVPAESLWDGLLSLDSLFVAYGPSASLKSVLMIGLGLAVKLGRPYLGRSTKKGVAVIVAAEGGSGIGARVAAAKAQENFTGTAGLLFVMEPVQLLDDKEVDAFIEQLRRLDGPVRLVEFDTLHWCMRGGDENSAKDMGAVLWNMDRIRRATGAAIGVVHHTNKKGEAERGHSSLRNDVTTVLEFKRDGNSDLVTVATSKQKDAPDDQTLRLRMLPAHGSVVLVCAEDDAELKPDFQSQLGLQALRALNEIALEDGVSATVWRDAARLPHTTFYRYRKSLLLGGLVEQVGRGRYRPTEDGNRIIGAKVP